MNYSIIVILSLISNQIYCFISFQYKQHNIFNHIFKHTKISNNRKYCTSHSNQSPLCTMKMSLADKITTAVKLKFKDSDISRVIKCWDNFSKGYKVDHYIDSNQEILQQADCYVDGLVAKPFHMINKETFPWAIELANNYQQIYSELQSYNNIIQSDANKEWLPPRDQLGGAYGPQWKTLGLQDRGIWEESDRIISFPYTMNLIKSLNIPSQEVFFAKQGPKSGILPHSDKNNFIITCHIGLSVPEGHCWIKVGNEKYFWKNGEAVIFDTSIIHSTMNEADTDRMVLLIRFWHPELNIIERNAFSFIFDYLDHAALGDEALEQFEMIHLFMGKDNHNNINTNSNSNNNKKKIDKNDNKRIKNNDKLKPINKGFGNKK